MRAREFITELARYAPADPDRPIAAPDYPTNDAPIAGMKVVIWNHYHIRCKQRALRNPTVKNVRVDKKLSDQIVMKISDLREQIESIPYGEFWIWSPSLHHSIGCRKLMPSRGLPVVWVKTVVGGLPWDKEGKPTLTV